MAWRVGCQCPPRRERPPPLASSARTTAEPPPQVAPSAAMPPPMRDKNERRATVSWRFLFHHAPMVTRAARSGQCLRVQNSTFSVNGLAPIVTVKRRSPPDERRTTISCSPSGTAAPLTGVSPRRVPSSHTSAALVAVTVMVDGSGVICRFVVSPGLIVHFANRLVGERAIRHAKLVGACRAA